MALTHQEFMGLSSKSWVQDPHANPFKHLAQLLSLFFFLIMLYHPLVWTIYV